MFLPPYRLPLSNGVELATYIVEKGKPLVLRSR